jgi:hypothetical protein
VALLLLLISIPQAGAELFQPQSSTTLFEGIYSRLRHPQALAIILFWSAIPLLNDSLTQLLVAIAAVCGIVCLIFKEEKDLILRFGDLYIYYRHLVPSFFPILRPEWNLRKELAKVMDRYSLYLDQYNQSAERIIREHIASGVLTEADGREQLQRLVHSPVPRTVAGTPVRFSSSPRPFECPTAGLSFGSAAATFVAQHRSPPRSVIRGASPISSPRASPQLVLHRFDHAIVEDDRLFQPKDRSKAPFHPLLVVEIQGEVKDGQYVCKKLSRGYPQAMVCPRFFFFSNCSFDSNTIILPA